ncbi:MAG: type I-B CRISPR-associated protein Cas7/Csh2 [Candidatus Zixiibacteriota bacterium]|nr:MAG: type I-B CRISPR-associated protein Cas7/Csh2 [candidate division Zixibacteria bacterium]
MQKENNNGIETIQNNSEILFIFEAKMTNPNGDPDDENRPRMDYDRNLNLVSDVRLKRYIRDYIANNIQGDRNKIFVRKIDGASVNAKKSLANILRLKESKKIELNSDQEDNFKNSAIDVRLFGAVVPDVKFANKSNATLTGAVQFNWGYSLNKFNGPIDSNGITSHFQTGKSSDTEESTKSSGAMGKDYRVGYSIIAFHGIISAKRAEQTNLSDSDIDIFDDAMVKAIPSEATTRSKMGQTPLFYLRAEYNSPDYFIGDLRRYIKLVNKENKEIPFEESDKLDWDKYKLDISKLKTKFENAKDNISAIYFWKHEDIELTGWELKEDNIVIQKVELPKEKKSEHQNG